MDELVHDPMFSLAVAFVAARRRRQQAVAAEAASPGLARWQQVTDQQQHPTTPAADTLAVSLPSVPCLS